MDIRLYDRIMAGRYTLVPYSIDPGPVHYNAWQAFSMAFAEMLRGAERIVADNIEEFCASAWPGDTARAICDLDIPSIAPPFPLFWVEWRNSQAYMREKGWIAGGVACQAYRIEEQWHMRWIPVGAYEGSPKGVLMAPFGFAETISDSEGKHISTDCHVTTKGMTREQRRQDEEWISAHVFPFLTAISFLNCRNVQLPWVQPQEKLARAFAKRNKGAKLAPYRTIDIIPMTRLIAEKAKAEGKAKGEVAFQTVRGHFKQYGNAGLFGKHKGTFFFGPHDRGSGDRKTRQGGYRIKI